MRNKKLVADSVPVIIPYKVVNITWRTELRLDVRHVFADKISNM